MPIVALGLHPLDQIVNVHWGGRLNFGVQYYILSYGSFVNATEDGPRFHTELVYPQPGTPYPGTPVEIIIEDPPPGPSFHDVYPNPGYILNCTTFQRMIIYFYTYGFASEIASDGTETIVVLPGPLITATISFSSSCVAAYTEAGGGWSAHVRPSDSLMTSKNGWGDFDVGAIVKYPLGPPLLINDREIPGFADNLTFSMRFEGKSIIGNGSF